MPRSYKHWKFYKRWRIAGTLRTRTSLQIGTGDVCEDERITKEAANGEIERADINAIFRDKHGKPLIPGSTIKGNLRAWLEDRTSDSTPLEQIFGRASKMGDQGRGGRAEFLDAHFKTELAEGDSLPYWDADKQTYIEVSTAINRITRTVEEEKLIHSEVVPAKVEFRLEITGAMTTEQIGLLLAALDGFNHGTHAVTFGAGGASGKGRMEWDSDFSVQCLDEEGVVEWLQEGATTLASNAMRTLDLDERDRLLDKGKVLIAPKTRRLVLGLTLQFDGPFLVNDPPPGKVEGTPDSKPLKDATRKPVLPAKSFRGALRSQAERIIRTLGGFCCEATQPCDPIYRRDDVKKLCLACQVFGAAGWQTTLHIHEFKFVKSDREDVRQDFIAIDRFHGGGKDGAKFDSRYSLRPQFKSALEIDQRMPDWGKGLLALALRDLMEGDIPLGFGANKGYGHLERVDIQDLDKLSEDNASEAFREICVHKTGDYTCDTRSTPTVREGGKQTLSDTAQAGDFHNPYHFVPVTAPDTNHWLEKKRLREGTMHDSHAIYRQRNDKKEPIQHGRIICRLETETPMFIGTESRSGEPAEIEPYRLNGETAIPATSLRGLISSLVETASNSALRVLDNGLLSYRRTVEQALSNIGVIVRRPDGWYLIPLEDPQRLKNAYTDPDMAAFIAAQDTWTPDRGGIFYRPPNGSGIPDQIPGNGKRPGILRILGKENRVDQIPNTKIHELFIPVPDEFVKKFEKFAQESEAQKITPGVIKRFEALADQRTESQNAADKRAELGLVERLSDEARLPFHLKGTRRNDGKVKPDDRYKLRLKHGDLVYFRSEKKQPVAEIAFSAIWRGRVESGAHALTVHNFFDQELRPFYGKREYISPAELMFGFVQDDRNSLMEKTRDKGPSLAFAGKVHISAGTLGPGMPKDPHDDWVPLKILASPKLPSPALYFKQRRGENTYIAKQDLKTTQHDPHGRKQYLHTLRKRDDRMAVQKLTPKGETATGGQALWPWQSARPEDDVNQKVRIQPIKKSTVFYFYVDFDNLSEWELGLLCYGLRPDDDFRHKLGMGKPIGLGSVRIDPVALRFIDRKQRYKQDDIDGARYNGGGWLDEQYRTELETIPEYATNISGQAKSPLEHRDYFIPTMDPAIRRALLLLGDPSNIKAPVHYPQVRGYDIEDKTYQWFVANDSGSGTGENSLRAKEDTLEPLNDNSEAMPTLKRHPWRNKDP